MSRMSDLGASLQSGERSVDFIGRRRTWFAISAVLVLISMLGLGLRQLDLGVEFDGGSVFEVRSATTSVTDVREIVEGAGGEEPSVQQLGSDRYRIETAAVSADEARPIQDALAAELGIAPAEITTQVVGPTWGSDVTNKALTSLLIFLGLLAVYLAIAFEWKMAVGALVALLHDLAITIGIYAIVGFAVTPATVIGLLTILGYSLYDTVVVFDKVRENTAGLSPANAKRTYSGAANLAVNQTLVRSINTTVIALLPVAGLLFVGAGLLGAGVLKDLALVLFVGMAVGAYSSIFLATPVVAALKEREPAMKDVARRVAQRDAALRKGASAKSPARAAVSIGKSSAGSVGPSAAADDSQADPPATPDPAPADDAAPAAARARAGVPPGARAQPRKGGTRSQRRPANKKRR